MMPPTARSGQQEIVNAVPIGIRMELFVIADRRGNDAGSTVRRSRHHTPARRIFLIDRHGIDTQPVIGEERVGTIGAPLLL